jgi:hypothetical protein
MKTEIQAGGFSLIAYEMALAWRLQSLNGE